jgi:hypothetical protein
MDPTMDPKTMKYLITDLINSILKNSSLEAHTHYSSFMSGMESKGLILSSQQLGFESVSEPNEFSPHSATPLLKTHYIIILPCMPFPSK